jgi:hypothetical protein
VLRPEARVKGKKGENFYFWRLPGRDEPKTIQDGNRVEITGTM